jgi:hypothetical protein
MPSRGKSLKTSAQPDAMGRNESPGENFASLAEGGSDNPGERGLTLGYGVAAHDGQM